MSAWPSARLRPLSAAVIILAAAVSTAVLFSPAAPRAGVQAAGAASLTSTVVLIATGDTWVAQSLPTQNYGNDTQLKVGHSNAGGLDLSLLLFDIGSLPAGINITGATLRVNVQDISGDLSPIPVTVRYYATSWDEGAVTWDTKPPAISPIASGDISGSGWATWNLTAQTRDWYGGHANYGVELGGPGTGRYTLLLSSREGASPPELVVVYAVAPTRTPTPTATPTATTQLTATPTNTLQLTATPTGTLPATRTPTATSTAGPSVTPTATLSAVSDLGDAPDSSNSFGATMNAYFGVQALFPTVFGAGSPPYGPRHRNEPPQFFLGKVISAEDEADTGFDADGLNNLNPVAGTADHDIGDDGLSFPATLAHCQPVVLSYVVNVLGGSVTQAYVNIWFDWNRNGRWGETPPCPGATAPEWAVQNQLITWSGTGYQTYSAPAFLPYNPDPSRDLWLRITISEVPAPGAGGTGPAAGYQLGETEDYLLPGVVASTATPTPTPTPTQTPTPTPTATPTVIDRPDFVITDGWNLSATLCYQIRNIGDATALPGHTTFVGVDGSSIAEDVIPVALVPGERLTRCLENAWHCTAPEDTVRICADYGGTVAEGDETNNCRQEIWPCDATSPVILSGPTVTDITSTSAVVSWETDEESTSAVAYGRLAERYDSQGGAPGLVKTHHVTLTGLQPSALYHLVARSVDAAGNSVASDDVLFETLPAPDSQDPQLSVTEPGECSGTIKIMAAASDDTGVDKVMFLLDGTLLSTDYAAPYELILDAEQHPNGTHVLKATACDLAGKCTTVEQALPICNLLPDTIGPIVEILNPQTGDTLMGPATVEVTVHAHDINPNVPGSGPVARVEFYVDKLHKWTDETADLPFMYSYGWHPWTASPGPHVLKTVAFDAAGNQAEDSVVVNVPEVVYAPLRPVLELERLPLEREGTWYRTGLRVRNVGQFVAAHIQLSDRLVGFQARPSGEGAMHCFWLDDSNQCTVILGGHLELAPGESEELTYRFVPVLIAGEEEFPYAVGPSTGLYYVGPTGDVYVESALVPETGDLEVDEAVESANYLIVTRPSALFDQYNDDDVNDLLMSMAKLAAEKEGVLGYFRSDRSSVLAALIGRNGAWSSQLSPLWGSNGYLLFVGETEIVPSKTVYDLYIRDQSIEAFGEDEAIYPIEAVDNWYADTTGNDYYPELVAGRIIGNDASNLRNAIETSLLRQFSCDSVLAVSGVDDARPDKEALFKASAEDVAAILGFANPSVLHWSDLGTDADRLALFKAMVSDRDVIYHAGHGGSTNWGDILHTADFPLHFGGSYPLVFAASCWTGEYMGKYSIAEAFLDNQAGAYIGATNHSISPTWYEPPSIFFYSWAGPGQVPSGRALKQTKRDVLSSAPDDWAKRLWVLEYNLYGDPKYGNCEMPAASSEATPTPDSVRAATYSLDVVVPDYTVTSHEGIDKVEIPGGVLMVEQDKPTVPYYIVRVEYAKGNEVDDVVLAERSGLQTGTGLNLPVGRLDLDSGEGIAGSTTSGEVGEWYPAEDFDWSVYENADGTATLVIRMYPFYYNPSTTDFQFYKNYRFTVSSTPSAVEITSLTTDQDAYRQGERVRIDIGLSTTAGPQDVAVRATIKRYGSVQTVDGLLLRELHGLQGHATLSRFWDSGSAEPGDYLVEVVLQDTAGHELDRKTERFTLGIISAELISLTADPQHFDIGDPVALAMTFKNTGSVPLDGTAVIQIRDGAGQVVEQFNHDISGLASGNSTLVEEVWDTSSAAEASYRVLGYVHYDSRATDAASVVVSTFPPATRCYLPLVQKR